MQSGSLAALIGTLGMIGTLVTLLDYPSLAMLAGAALIWIAIADPRC
jgi:hypothetical protein